LITVDAFCHVGDCCIYETSVSESDVMDALNANRVSAAILQPFPGPPNPAAVHDRIAELGAKQPGRVFGVASANPHIDRDRYYREIERCVHDLGFVGVALDTFGHVVNPNGRDAKTVFEVARELAIPVVVETGWGAPFGLPSAILPRAREYNDVKIVLAHAGAGLYTFEAYVVAREVPNVYLETSWCRSDDVRWLINELGAHRVMLGSDLASNQEAELAKYRSLGLFHFQQYQVLGQSAIDVFGLKGVTEIAEPVPVVELSEPAVAPVPAVETNEPAGEPARPAETVEPEATSEPVPEEEAPEPAEPRAQTEGVTAEASTSSG